MPTQKSKPRTSTSRRRIKKYEETYRAKTVPLYFKKSVPVTEDLLEEWLNIQDELEQQLFALYEDLGVDPSMWVFYTSFARRLMSKCLDFTSLTYGSEKTSLRTEFDLRGLNLSVLDEVINIVDYKCYLVKGVAAEPRYSMMFLSVIDNEIDLPAAAADINLPDVVISGLPTNAVIDKVLVFLIVRAIENTNAGGANAIQGTQYIRIKKSTGAWGVDDVACIQLIDNMWTVAASTREFGDVIGGDNARDCKSEVDGNATYNLRFEDADVDLDSLRLNDVQVLIKVWYH